MSVAGLVGLGNPRSDVQGYGGLEVPNLMSEGGVPGPGPDLLGMFPVIKKCTTKQLYNSSKYA